VYKDVQIKLVLQVVPPAQKTGMIGYLQTANAKNARFIPRYSKAPFRHISIPQPTISTKAKMELRKSFIEIHTASTIFLSC
jgi:hypothetical protein